MIFYFGPFVLKPEQYGLEVAGEPRQLQPKVFELLTFLVANRDRVVSKEELLGNIWDGAYVTEAAISRAVSEARKVLAGGGGSAGWITTVYGRGFRFTGPVIEDLAAPEGAPSVAVPPPPEERTGTLDRRPAVRRPQPAAGSGAPLRGDGRGDPPPPRPRRRPAGHGPRRVFPVRRAGRSPGR